MSAGSAATSAARSTSTARATCSCRRATTRTRSSRRATRGSTIAETATGVRRPVHVRQHERPPRQTPAHPRPETAATPSRGQHVPAGHGADPSRDLRDGLPQPVPLRGQPAERATSTSVTTRRRPVAIRARPRGHRPVDDRPPAGQLRLAVLHHAGSAVRRPRLHPRCRSASEEFNCFAADQRLAEQHRPAPPAAGRATGRLVLVQHRCGAVPGAVQNAGGNGIGPMGGRRCSSTPRSARRSGGRGTSRGIRSSTSGRVTT